jgi:hypothetical protein
MRTLVLAGRKAASPAKRAVRRPRGSRSFRESEKRRVRMRTARRMSFPDRERTEKTTRVGVVEAMRPRTTIRLRERRAVVRRSRGSRRRTGVGDGDGEVSVVVTSGRGLVAVVLSDGAWVSDGTGVVDVVGSVVLVGGVEATGGSP